jgi:hypothetical protein
MIDKSAIAELLEFDFESMPLMQLYRGADPLLKHNRLFEDLFFENVQDLFGFPEKRAAPKNVIKLMSV